MSELKFAVRQLLKNPGFTTIAVLTLALGIGANTALFSVVNGVLLRPLPFSQQERRVTLYDRRAHGAGGSGARRAFARHQSGKKTGVFRRGPRSRPRPGTYSNSSKYAL